MLPRVINNPFREASVQSMDTAEISLWVIYKHNRKFPVDDADMFSDWCPALKPGWPVDQNTGLTGQSSPGLGKWPREATTRGENR